MKSFENFLDHAFGHKSPKIGEMRYGILMMHVIMIMLLGVQLSSALYPSSNSSTAHAEKTEKTIERLSTTRRPNQLVLRSVAPGVVDVYVYRLEKIDYVKH